MKNITCILILLMVVAKLQAQTCASYACPASPVEACDYTSNDPQFWNEGYWLDPVTGLNDMPDAPVELILTATDTCLNGSITIKYILFLDLDGNGSQETAVGSDSLPGFNLVNYGNAIGGGTPRAFDERPVSANEKYGFALETLINGATTTARVRWNTESQPGVYANPELPYGLHKIKWFITDAQGHESVCEYNFEVKDCKSPTIVCTNGLIIYIMATGTITVWATDFLQYTDDNHTPANQLQLGIRKAGDGSGFPQDSAGNPIPSVTFNCDELGENPIELWSKDQTGNSNFCQTILTVEDPNNFCGVANWANLTICSQFFCNGTAVANVDYGLGSPDAFDPNTGCAIFENTIPLGNNYVVTPSKDDDHLNGLNTLDIIRISWHILGLKPLPSPYAMIAADANKSNSITTFDMLELKKLIQGIYTELPNNTSWRFVDASFVFPNPNNPFQTQFPQDVAGTAQDSVLNLNFIGIKVGDVDCSAAPGFAPQGADDRSAAVLTLPDAMLLPGETLDLPLRISNAADWLGFQMSLHFDPKLLEIETVEPGNLPDMDESTFASPRPGTLNAVWFNPTPQQVLPNENLALLKIKAKNAVRVSEAIVLANEKIAPEAYTAGEATQKLALRFIERAESDGETAIFPAQPNPTSAGARIPLRLAQTEKVMVELADFSGKLLWFNQITLNAGTHLLEIPASETPQSGVYVWRVQAGASATSGKLVKL